MIGNPLDLPSFDPATGLVNAVIETPKHSRVKIDLDPVSGCYKTHDILPEGFTFPFNFGLIPGTLAGDGDPLDILLITDAEIPMGALATARLVGVIEAEEVEDGRRNRNDRLLAVPSGDPALRSVERIEHLRAELVEQIERFFETYGEFKGKQWKTLGRGGPERARSLVESAREAKRKRAS